MRAIADRYTAALIHSHERQSFALAFAGALSLAKGDPAQRIALGSEFAEHSRKHGHAFVDALTAVDALRDEVALGDGCGQPLGCAIGPNTQPQCFIDGRRLCDYDRVGARTLSTAGDAVFSITPSPGAGSAWWRAKAARGWAFRASDPSIPAWEGLFITSITVGTAPVEGFNTPPTAAVLSGISFSDYVVPDANAIGVGWPVFSNSANEQQLVISGIGLWPTASNYIAMMTVLGNRWNPGSASESRCNPDSTPLPTMVGSYTATGNFDVT